MSVFDIFLNKRDVKNIKNIIRIFSGAFYLAEFMWFQLLTEETHIDVC